ncbi:MAG: Ltp family lipoprotein [Marinosulfonomonas sp.]|nr:Ltp family lipoprotein [Marinosulfonomonas sp.]
MHMFKLATTVAITFVLMGTSAASAQSLSGPQKNAVRSANSYLSISGFSRDGLINQLSSPYGDGYSVVDARAAVESLSVNWNEQAVRSAQQYLSIMGFSCSGLINQLSSDAGDKYTVDQATYGAQQSGAC